MSLSHGPDDRESLSGLNVSQAKEFNSLFITSFLIFTAIALAAHVAAWAWRPWARALPTADPAAASAPLTPGAPPAHP